MCILIFYIGATRAFFDSVKTKMRGKPVGRPKTASDDIDDLVSTSDTSDSDAPSDSAMSDEEAADQDVDMTPHDDDTLDEPPPKKQRQDPEEHAKHAKEQRQQQKQLLHDRRAQKPFAEQLAVVKKCWEKLRHPDTPKETRHSLVSQILDTLGKGNVQEVVLKHDASRVIQACIKYGTPQQRQHIVHELQGCFLDLSKSKYGKFLALKALKYCPKQRSLILKEWQGHVEKLIRHVEAALVIDDAFVRFANASQRAILISEFYGPEFRLYQRTNPSQTPTLSTFLSEKDATPERREALLQHMLSILQPIFDKGTYTLAITHHLMSVYLETATNPRQRQALCDVVKEHICDIVHTKEGSNVVADLILYASPKDRKIMVRAMKPWVVKMACSDYGWWPLIRALDCIDDTVLLNKSLLAEIMPAWASLCRDKNGRLVILYLLAGRSPRYFSPRFVNIWNNSDHIRAETSKKDPQIRHEELLKQISSTAIQFAAAELKSILKETSLQGPVLLETLVHAEGDKSSILQCLTTVIKEALDADQDDALADPIQFSDSVLARFVKTLVQLDKSESPTGVCVAIWEACKGHVVRLARDGWGFVMLALLETPSGDSERIRRELLDELSKQKKDFQKLERSEVAKKFAGIRLLAGKFRELKAS